MTKVAYSKERVKDNVNHDRPLVMSGYQKIIFLFLNQNICCGYSTETSQ